MTRLLKIDSLLVMSTLSLPGPDYTTADTFEITKEICPHKKMPLETSNSLVVFSVSLRGVEQ